MDNISTEPILNEVAALQSLYGSNAIKITSADSQDSNNLMSDKTCVVQIQISPRINGNSQPIEVWLSNYVDPDLPCDSNAGLSGKVPEFNRTVSGKRWHATFSVESLPQVQLCGILESGLLKSFTLSSNWLNACELSKLCNKMDVLCEQYADMHVLSALAAFIENDLLMEVGIEPETPYAIYDDVENSHDLSYDDRAIATSDCSLDCLAAILQHDLKTAREKWECSLHECPICFAELLGSEMQILENCEHVICNQCITDYVHQRMETGEYMVIPCPEQGCDAVINATILKKVMTDEDFSKWESMCSQKFLDIADDLDWCPRCNLVAAKPSTKAEPGDTGDQPSTSTEEKSVLALCAYCGYAYCASCKNAYHPATDCQTLEDLLDELMQTDEKSEGNEKNKKNVRKGENTNPTVEEQKRISAAKTKQQILSQILVRTISKKCPKCGVAIQKIDGCDKVTCTLCGSFMCWICGRKIKGYEHFGTPACNGNDLIWDRNMNPFGDVPQALQEQQQLLEEHPQLANRLTPCPRCKHDVLKTHTDNNMKCPTCRTNFCYKCASILRRPITKHFGIGSACKQHSDD